MPKNPNAKKEESSQSAKNIRIVVRKQTAGAVAGAAAGSIAGPLGAVIGGAVGAVAGKAAEKGRPIAPAARKTVRSVVKRSKTLSRAPGRRRLAKKTSAKARKAPTRRKRSRDRRKKRH